MTKCVASGRLRPLLCSVVLVMLGIALVPRGSTFEKLLLVAVACPDGHENGTEVLTESEGFPEDGCERRLLAYLSADSVLESMGAGPDAMSGTEPLSATPSVKPGWPLTLQRFQAQTLATADVDDPRGRATILNETDGVVHSLASDASPIASWPATVSRVTISTMPTAIDLDEDSRDEVLITGGIIHLLSQDASPWPGWPFEILSDPSDGFQARTAIGVRLREGEPSRVVAGSGRRIFVLDQAALPLPGWPVEIPKGVFARPDLANVAVGDIRGGPEAEIIATISNEHQVFGYDMDGQLLTGFPVQRFGQAQDPSLADLDGDGKQEILLWADFNSSTPGILALTGAGQVLAGWPRPVQSGTGNFGVAAGDVDGDGDLEVLASTINGGEAGAGGVYLWHADGTPVSGWPKFFPNVSFPNPVVIADVDGDGIGDPVVAGFSVVSPIQGRVYAWKGTGELIPGFPIAISSRPIALGAPTIDDLEGDGIADLGLSTRQALTIILPGRVHWYDLGVPYRAEGMEWPTRAHDMARTAAYKPPVRRVPMEVQIAPPRSNARALAQPLTVILRLPPAETARPSLLRLRFVDDERVPELEGILLEDDGEAIVFRFDGEAVRALVAGPGEHRLGFWTEAVGGLGGVLYEGESTFVMRDPPRRAMPARAGIPLQPAVAPPSLAPAPDTVRSR